MFSLLGKLTAETAFAAALAVAKCGTSHRLQGLRKITLCFSRLSSSLPPAEHPATLFFHLQLANPAPLTSKCTKNWPVWSTVWPAQGWWLASFIPIDRETIAAALTFTRVAFMSRLLHRRCRRGRTNGGPPSPSIWALPTFHWLVVRRCRRGRTNGSQQSPSIWAPPTFHWLVVRRCRRPCRRELHMAAGKPLASRSDSIIVRHACAVRE